MKAFFSYNLSNPFKSFGKHSFMFDLWQEKVLPQLIHRKRENCRNIYVYTYRPGVSCDPLSTYIQVLYILPKLWCKEKRKQFRTITQMNFLSFFRFMNTVFHSNPLGYRGRISHPYIFRYMRANT